MPRPIPRLPPDTNATRFLSDMLYPRLALFVSPPPRGAILHGLSNTNHGRKSQPKIATENRGQSRRYQGQYSPALPNCMGGKRRRAALALFQARHNHRHIVRLLRGSGPLFHAGHERLADFARRQGLHANRGLLEPRYAELLAVDILRLDQPVAVADEQRIARHRDDALFVIVVLDDPENHAAFIEVQRFGRTQQERGKVSGVAVAQRACGTVVHRNKERREAVVTRIAHQMLVEPRYEFRGAQPLAARRQHLAAQRRLQAGHQQRGGNSLAGNIGDGDSHLGGADLNEIVVIAADRAGRFANRFDLDSRDRWYLPRKELILYFPGDGNFIFESLAAGFFVDQIVDRTSHFIERFAQHSQLVLAVHADAMRKIARLDVARGGVEIVHRGGDAASHHNAGKQRRCFNHQKRDHHQDKWQQIDDAEFADGRKDARVQAGGPGAERGDYRPAFLDGGGFTSHADASI